MKRLCKNCKYYQFVDEMGDVDIQKHTCYYNSIDPVTGNVGSIESNLLCVNARRQAGFCGIEGKYFIDKNQLLTEGK